MSNNFYATINAEGDETTPVINLHLGKTTQQSVMLDGNLFPSFAAMRMFLNHNAKNLTITSESGVEMSVPEFVRMFESASLRKRRHQFNWFEIHGTDSESERHWLDAEGFTMSKGTWF